MEPEPIGATTHETRVAPYITPKRAVGAHGLVWRNPLEPTLKSMVLGCSTPVKPQRTIRSCAGRRRRGQTK